MPRGVVFEVPGERLTITEVGSDYVADEETRKNGQEDCHMSGILETDVAGRWSWNEGEKMFVHYGSQELADAIVDYLNKHGMPQ